MTDAPAEGAVGRGAAPTERRRGGWGRLQDAAASLPATNGSLESSSTTLCQGEVLGGGADDRRPLLS